MVRDFMYPAAQPALEFCMKMQRFLALTEKKRVTFYVANLGGTAESFGPLYTGDLRALFFIIIQAVQQL